MLITTSTVVLGTFILGCGGDDKETATGKDATTGTTATTGTEALTYPINATAQTSCYNNTDKITCPKSGDAGDYPNGHGPQGDVIKIDNYARCVRDA